MDPATIFQIVSTVISLGDVVIKCITRLSAVKSQYFNAPIIVTSMIGQLHTVKIAQDQLSLLRSLSFSHDQRCRQLAAQIGKALNSIGLILLALEQKLDRYENILDDQMTAKKRMGFLHGERELTNLSTMLDRQVNALSLLLHAIQCQILDSQKHNQSIIRLTQDPSSSVVGLEDVTSFTAENSAAISIQFEFDEVLQNSLPYQAAKRSHLGQAIRAKKTKDLDNTLSDSLTEQRTKSSLRRAFRTVIISKPTALPNTLQTKQSIRRDIQHEIIGEPSENYAVTDNGTSSQEYSPHSNSEDTDRASSRNGTGRQIQLCQNKSDSNALPARPNVGDPHPGHPYILATLKPTPLLLTFQLSTTITLSFSAIFHLNLHP
ncbi:hypothetical protein F4678DRAFT_457236 [Xylaria arbuscula]|nr:hypothetical protein F4678DRAFT_457236 [Xylaria arbuscula]